MKAYFISLNLIMRYIIFFSKTGHSHGILVIIQLLWSTFTEKFTVVGGITMKKSYQIRLCYIVDFTFNVEDCYRIGLELFIIEGVVKVI